MATRKIAKGKAGRAKTVAKAKTARAKPKRAGAQKMPKAMPIRKVRPGFVSHTELASADPAATKAWAQEVLGWKFRDPMPTPDGPYEMWAFDGRTGGGIRRNNPPEVPGSIPYCEVPSLQPAYEKALKHGAEEMLTPMALPGGFGAIAIVRAPGGVPIGFWGPK